MRPSGPLEGSTKVVGVLGGMGPAATIEFLRRLVESTDADHDQEHLHVLLDNRPQVPDRIAFVLGRGDDPVPMLVEMAQRLERAGADLLVIACNTANALLERVDAEVSVPVVDWIGEVAASIGGSSPPPSRIGLLATAATVELGIFEFRLASYGIAVVCPDVESQAKITDSISGDRGVKSRAPDLAEMSETLSLVAERLVADGADALLVACTELSLLAPRTCWPEAVRVYDAAQIVAERTISLAGAPVKSRALAGAD